MPVSVLTDLLTLHNEDDLDSNQVDHELALALQAHGYPADALTVTPPDAVAILEWLDAGIVKSTPEQRAALAGGFRHSRIPAPKRGAGPSAPKPTPPPLRSTNGGAAS